MSCCIRQVNVLSISCLPPPVHAGGAAVAGCAGIASYKVYKCVSREVWTRASCYLQIHDRHGWKCMPGFSPVSRPHALPGCCALAKHTNPRHNQCSARNATKELRPWLKMGPSIHLAHFPYCLFARPQGM